MSSFVEVVLHCYRREQASLFRIRINYGGASCNRSSAGTDGSIQARVRTPCHFRAEPTPAT
jgi:hypothetical protein